MSVQKLEFGDDGIVVLSSSDRESQVELQSAYLRGLKDGQAVLRDQMEAMTTYLRSEVEACKISWDTVKREWSSYAEEQTFRTACDIVQKILSAEAIANPLLLYATVKCAVQQIVGSTEVRVRVPAQHVSLWKIMEQDNLRIVPDASLEAGQVKVEAEIGSADFGIAAQISEIRSVLLENYVPASTNLQ